MIPSCFPWKVVIFFGKEHVNWSSIRGVMMGLSWKIKLEKINYLFGYYENLKGQNTNFEFSKSDFSTSSYHNSNYTEPIDMIFTKKCNYFSRGTRWDHPFLSQSQYKHRWIFCQKNPFFPQSTKKLWKNFPLFFT